MGMGFEYQIISSDKESVPLEPLAQALQNQGIHIFEKDEEYFSAVYKLPINPITKRFGGDIYAEKEENHIYLLAQWSGKKLRESFPAIEEAYRKQGILISIKEL